MQYGTGDEMFDSEGRVLTLEFTNLVLLSVYAPHSGEEEKKFENRIKIFDESLRRYLSTLKAVKTKPIIVAGDLNVALNNIDIFDPEKNKNTPGFRKEER